MKFKQYESKPVLRQAFQITEDHLPCKVEGEEATYAVGEHVGKPFIKFKAYEDPKVGDWVVRLTETDTYHCTDAVFRERNIVHSHTLYTDGDKDKPEQICDSNGQVVLGMCKFCKRAEVELVDPCE